MQKYFSLKLFLLFSLLIFALKGFTRNYNCDFILVSYPKSSVGKECYCQKNLNDFSTIIIYREKRRLSSAVIAKLDLNGRVLYLENSGVVRFDIQPGMYDLRNLNKHSENFRKSTPFIFEPGKKYYIKYCMDSRLIGGRDYFILVDEEWAHKEIYEIEKKHQGE